MSTKNYMEWYTAPVSTVHHMKLLRETGAWSPHISQLLFHSNGINNSYNMTPDDIDSSEHYSTHSLSHSFIHSLIHSYSNGASHISWTLPFQIDMFLIIQTCKLQTWIWIIIFHFTDFSKPLFSSYEKVGIEIKDCLLNTVTLPVEN